MFKFLQTFRSRKNPQTCFHPDTPVKPEVAVNIKELKVFRREYFPDEGRPIPWLDREDAPEIVASLREKGEINDTEQELCLKWIKDGYIILENFFAEELLDEVWSAYEKALADKSIEPIGDNCQVNGLPERNLNAHMVVKQIKQLFKHQKITSIISLLLGAKSLPFQTIIGHNGSQQLEHSDAIHMTTYPLDYLAATWTAFEDIDPNAGPLVYYPGSHRQPHFLSKEAGISIDEFQTRSYLPYHEKYEPGLQKIIQDNQLEAKYFIAKKGDVLIWHSNLIHGGSLRQDLTLSRKALVCHYFAEGCVCYHDLASSLSYLHS